jgi:hypothetical protein
MGSGKAMVMRSMSAVMVAPVMNQYLFTNSEVRRAALHRIDPQGS